MTQFMVFLNGLILTLTAYFVFTMYTRDMIHDDYQRVMNDARQEIGQNINELEQAILTLSTVLALAEETGPEQISRRVSVAGNPLEKFERVVWLRKNADGDWRADDIISHRDGQPASPASEQAFINHIVTLHQSGPGRSFVSTDVPGEDYAVAANTPSIKARPFLIVHPVEGADGDSIVAGLVHATRIASPEWLANRPALLRLTLRDSKSDRPIFYLDRDTDRSDYGMPPAYGLNHGFSIAGSEWELLIEAGKDSHSLYLEKMPLLLLGFGLMLTLIGTAYVRMNQQQSYRHASMNRILAEKNAELNREVSERERLNQNLRRAEREYRSIIDAVSDIIFEASTDGEILFLNSTWEKITGFDVTHSLSRKLFDLIHPQDQEEQRRQFSQLVRGQKPAYRVLTRIRTANGTFRWVELAFSMLRQDENKTMRVVGAITDIEERRRAEKALTEAEKKYRTIVENAAGGIYQVTPEGQFLSANPAMARILGYETQEQLLREIKNAHDLYENRQEHARFVRELEESGQVVNFEAQVMTRSGRRIWTNENARTVRDDEGNILYFEGSMEDITRRKETELKLREAKVQSDLASRAKSEFLTNMSHELRTPLNAIIGFSEIIRDEVLGPLGNPQYRDYVKDIHESGRRLLHIINEILDVSRIEAGERQLNEGIVDVNNIVKSCLEFTWQKAQEGRLTLVNLTAGEIPKVIGEELALKQILLNLMSNAIKFTPPNGHITISHEVDQEGQLRVSVTDTGIGLDEWEIEKALSAFGQLETGLGKSSSGAGLGLTLVDSLIRLHGGRLELFSQKGIGTTATIIIPARRVAHENAAETGDGHPHSGSIHPHTRRDLQ